MFQMKATKVQSFILYALGKWFEEANKKIQDKSLEVSISKALFIDMAKKAKFAEKQERALYKNLEILEKKKLISYNTKELMLTNKGKKVYDKISCDLGPYFYLIDKLKKEDPILYTKKVQTIFKR